MASIAGLTAIMAYFVDTIVTVIFDYKYGFCKGMFPCCGRAFRQERLNGIRYMAFEQKKMLLWL
jgi:hypothetical protein